MKLCVTTIKFNQTYNQVYSNSQICERFLRKVSNLKDFEEVPVIGYTTWPKVLEFGATFVESLLRFF